MRKAISFSLILLIFLLIYQYGINSIKQEHYVEYYVKKDKSDYKIEEEYSKKDNDSYLIRITDENNHSYVFDVKNAFNKQREIVKDIILYDDEDIHCVALSLVNNLEYVEPQCSIDDVNYSYTYVMKDRDITKFLDSIEGFDYKKYDKESELREDSGIKVYKSNLEDREEIILYDYKRVVFHTNINSNYFTFATTDNYKNTIGKRVGQYYMIPKVTENATISTFIKYNLSNDLKNDIPVPKISKNFYINGVHDDKLYLFDKSDMKQYVIDPYNSSVTVVSDEENGIIYNDGKEEKVSIYEMAEEEVVFGEDLGVYKKLDYDEIYLGNGYAVYLKDGHYYKVYKKYLDSPILILDDDDVNEIKINDNNIYYIKDDSIYRHNKYGDIILLSKNELRFNKDNIYDIYFTE